MTKTIQSFFICVRVLENDLQTQLCVSGFAESHPLAPLLPFLVVVSSPKLPLVNVALGLAQFIRLNRLKISARNSTTVMRSGMGVRLKIEKSTEPNPGP